MEPASPARLYASAAGALLVLLGIVGFFYDASFTALDNLQPALGAIDVNAWFNLLYVFTGAVGVLVAGAASGQYSLAVGLLYTLLGIFGPGTEWLHLAIGVLGLAAAAGTPKRGQVKPKGGGSKPRAKTVRNRA
ncbi:MAG TPA: DUF4383 domain-containing protein [Solirubrobacterales bacterium]|jgi:hypothetical protein|nr:DUF4383 domain-containing protein [Solirubrobacterales bacterium]